MRQSMGIAMRLAKRCVVGAVFLLVIWVVFVQFQNQLFHHRAAHLLADVRTLRIDRASAADTSAVFQRWKHWGYTSTECSPSACTYTIQTSNTLLLHLDRIGRMHLWWLFFSTPAKSLGAHHGIVAARFTVKDGTLRNAGLFVLVTGGSEYNDPSVSVVSRPNLGSERDYMGYEGRLAAHPNYFVGRPGGCEGCLHAWIEYTAALSESDWLQLTAFHLDCLTAFHRCKTHGDLLPMLERYHLYDEDPLIDRAPSPQCPISPRTAARDAASVVAVKVLAVRSVKPDPERVAGYLTAESAKVQPLETLKGRRNFEPGKPFIVTPFIGEKQGSEDRAPEHMKTGENALLMSWPGGAASLDHCAIWPDTPSVRSEVAKGIAEDDDAFYSKEPYYGSFYF